MLNARNKQLELHVFSRKYGVGLLGLVETKLTKAVLIICKNKWFKDGGYLHYWNTSSGMIWVLWNASRLEVEPFHIDTQWIHVKVEGILWRCLFSMWSMALTKMSVGSLCGIFFSKELLGS